MTKTEFETLRNAAAEHLVEAERELFTVGADFAYELMQSRISELEKQWQTQWTNEAAANAAGYNESIEKIQSLEAKLAIAKEYWTWLHDHLVDHYNKVKCPQCKFHLDKSEKALAQLEGKAE